MSAFLTPKSSPPASDAFDVIVVGARCAGAATALLLARQGVRVLVVDRVAFPRDTMRGHLMRGDAMSALDRWGMLPALLASGCPAIEWYESDFGDGPLRSPVQVIDGVPFNLAPRRHVLDTLLLEAAAAAGATVLAPFSASGVLVAADGAVRGIRGRTPGGAEQVISAGLVIGADGQYSRIADLVGAPVTHLRPAATLSYTAYFTGEPLTETRFALHRDRFVLAAPTHDGDNLVNVAITNEQFVAFRRDPDAVAATIISGVPWLAGWFAGQRRIERWTGSNDLPAYFRQATGPGWALVGDASYHQHPNTGRGIGNAYRDAETLASGIVAGLGGEQPLAECLAAYAARRDIDAAPGFAEAFAWSVFAPVPDAVLTARAAARQAGARPAAA